MELPPTKLLDRDLSLAITKPLRDLGRPLLREVVNQSIAVFERCSATATGDDENAGLLFPYLQLAELLDSLEVSLDSAAGAAVLLRAAFEALLTVEWVARDTTLRYGAAYVVVDIHKRISGWEKVSRGHEQHKALRAIFDADNVARHVDVPVAENAAKRIASLQSLLRKPHLREAAEEFDRLSKARKPLFHAFWQGPRTIEQLATQLGRGGQYQILYRNWSANAHAQDLQRQLTSVDGAPAIRVFRNGENLLEGYNFGVGFGLAAMQVLLRHYRPEEMQRWYAPWYEQSIQSSYTALTTMADAAAPSDGLA